MFRHDALRRGIGAAWVIIFLTTLLLPIGIASGASRPLWDAADTGGAQLPIVDAQAADPPAPEGAAELPPAEPVEVPPVRQPAAPLSEPSGQQAVLAAQATLEVRQQLVEVSPPPSPDWTRAQPGQVVTEGYRIRTNESGSARLVYFEGSATSISPNTGLLVQQLQRTEGNPVTHLLQTAGTTVNRVLQLVDPSARFEVETPAATAFLRGTDFGVSQRPDLGTARRFLFQNFSTPTGGNPVEVCGFGNCVTILGGQEVLATEGAGPGQVVPLGRSDQQAQNQQQQVTDPAAAGQSAALAAQMNQAAQFGAAQAAVIQQRQAIQAAQQQQLFNPQIANQGAFLPPPPPPPLFAQPSFFNFPCVTPTPPARTPTPTATITPTATVTPFTLTPTASPTFPPNFTPTLTPTRTPTLVPPGAVAATPTLAAGVAPVFLPDVAFVCTPTPVATPTVTPLVTPVRTPTPTTTPTPIIVDPVEVATNGADRVFVALRSANAVAIIDAVTNTTITRVPLIPLPVPPAPGVAGTGLAPVNPQAIAFTPSIQNGPGTPFVYTANRNGTVSVIDVNAGALVATIDLSRPISPPGPAVTMVPDPAGILVFTPQGGGNTDILVTDRANNVVHIIDGPTNALVARIALPPGSQPEGLDACDATNTCAGAPNTVFVALRGRNSVAVIDFSTKTLAAGIPVNPIPVGTQPTDVEVRGNTNYVYVTNFGSNNTSVIDIRCIFVVCAGTPPGPFPASTSPVVATLVDASAVGPIRVAAQDLQCASPTGGSVPCNRVYVVNQTSGNVSIFLVVLPGVQPAPGPGGGVPSISFEAPTAVPVGDAPRGVDVISGRNLAYVAVPGTNDIRVFQGIQVIATIRM